MARSSLVCSIWQRYDFIPNIRCYQPEKSADPLRATGGAVFILPSEEEGLVRGGAPFGKGDGGIRKTPFLMGKSDANERNESSLSNC